MPDNLKRYRHSAYIAQSGRCYYCDFLIWESDPQGFAQIHRITVAQARLLQSTAEHLQAKQDGGKDVAPNIAAACWICNFRRHARKRAPDAGAFSKLVKSRVSKGRWHDQRFHLIPTLRARENGSVSRSVEEEGYGRT